MGDTVKTSENTDLDVPTLTEEDIAKIVVEMDDKADVNPVAGIDAIQKHVEESLLFLNHEKVSSDPETQNDQLNPVKKILWEPMKPRDKEESGSDGNQVVSTDKSIDDEKLLEEDITKTVDLKEETKVTVSSEILKDASVSGNETEDMDATCVESNKPTQVEENTENNSENCDNEIKGVKENIIKKNIKKEIDVDVQATVASLDNNKKISTLKQIITDTTDKMDKDKDNLGSLQRNLETTGIDTTRIIDSVSIKKEVNISEDESSQSSIMKESKAGGERQNETKDTKPTEQELLESSDKSLKVFLPVKEEVVDLTYEISEVPNKPIEDDHTSSICPKNVNNDSQQMDVTDDGNIESIVWETIANNNEDQIDTNNTLQSSIEAECADVSTLAEIDSEEETILGEDIDEAMSETEQDIESCDAALEENDSSPKHKWESRVKVEKNTDSNDSVKQQENKDGAVSTENSNKGNLKDIPPVVSTTSQPKINTNRKETLNIDKSSMRIEKNKETDTPLVINKQNSQTKRPAQTAPSNETTAKRMRFESGSTEVDSADIESNATIEDVTTYLSKRDINEFYKWAPIYLKCNDHNTIADMIELGRKNKCVLRLGNLPKVYNFKDVYNLVKKYTVRGGPEISKSIAFIYNDKSQNPPGSTAYVKWKSKDSILVVKAMELMKMSRLTVQGRLITVHYDKGLEIEWDINDRPIINKKLVLPQKKTRKIDPFVNGEINPDDTNLYGLKEDFLSSLNIEPPLTCYVSVNNLDKTLDEIKVRIIFKAAGNILAVRMKVEADSLKVWIQYEHPLEVVQAISMFDKQELSKRVIVLNMEQKFPSDDLTSLGFTKLGPGLGNQGDILKGVAVNSDLQYLKSNTANDLFSLQKIITRYNARIKDVEKNQWHIHKQNKDDASDVLEHSVSTSSAQNIIAAISSAISSSVQDSIMTLLGFQSKNSTQNTPKGPELSTNAPKFTQTSPKYFKNMNKQNVDMQGSRNFSSKMHASPNTQRTNMPTYNNNMKTVPNVQQGNMQVATGPNVQQGNMQVTNNIRTEYNQNQTSMVMQGMQYNPNMQIPSNMQVMPDMQTQYDQNMQAWQNMQQLSYMQAMMYMPNVQTVPTTSVIPDAVAYNPATNIQPVFPYSVPTNQPSTPNVPSNIPSNQPQISNTNSNLSETKTSFKPAVETKAPSSAVIESGPKITKPFKTIITGPIKKTPKLSIPLPVAKPQKRDASGLVIKETPIKAKSPQKESVAWISKQIKAMRRNSKSPELSKAKSPKYDKFGFTIRDVTSERSDRSRERELVILREIEKIKEAEKAKEKQREIEKQKEAERIKNEEKRELEKIKEKQREIEREIEKAKEKQREIERQREIDRQREADRMNDKYRPPDRFRDADIRPGTLIFKYLPSSVSLEDLRDKMAEIGKVSSATVLGKGQALVTFRYSRDAEICIDMYNRSKVDGQTIEVKWK